MAKLIKTKTPGLFRRPAGGWIIDKMVERQRIYRTLDDIPESLAKKILSKLVTEITEATFFPEKANRSLKINDALNIYWTEYLQFKKSAKNAKFLFNPVNNILGDKLISALSHKDIEQYKRERLSQPTRYGTPTSAVTVNHELQVLSASLNWLVKGDVIPRNPIARYERAKQATPAKIVIDEGHQDGPQWQKILDCADPDTIPILICLYETGMRPAEVFQMRWDWIEEITESAWMITVPAKLEKTGSERKIPVSPKLQEVLKSSPRHSELVFPSPVTGEPRVGIQRAFQGILRRAGLQNRGITPYALRRTRITIWDEIDGDACRYVVGHTAKDVHAKHYRRFTSERLFKLVGVEFDWRERYQVLTKSA